MNKTSRDPILIGAAIILPILLVFALGGQLGILVHCGQFGRFGKFPPAGILTVQLEQFAATKNGCYAQGPAFWVPVAVLFVIAVAIAVTIYLLVDRYKQSDKYFVKQLKLREGIAKSPEIARFFGGRRALKMGKTIRPSLVEGKKKVKDAKEVAFKVGVSMLRDVWLILEESILLIGAPRSGKGVHVVIAAIVDSPGAVVTTSTRADNYAATYKVREANGSKVTLFDPQGLTGQKTTLKWSPITGCEKPLTAQQRANSLISASGLGKGGSNEEWRAPAVLILQSLLHAAAVGHRGMDDLIRWGNDMGAAREAVDVMTNSPRAAQGWAGALSDVIDGDAKLAGSKWFGVSNVMVGLSVPEIREVMDPLHESEMFNIDEFILGRGTLYLVGTKTGGGSVGAFLIAMMDSITERAREMAAKLPGNRLDPPMTLVLDEIANMAGAWPGLTTLMADGGGIGIVPIPVFQSLSQARDNWGLEASKSIFDAATVKILLGGSSSKEDLDIFSSLMGTREITKESTSYGKDHTSYSEQRQDIAVLAVDELRRVPFGYGIMFGRTSRPVFLELQGYWKRKDAKQIGESKKSYDPAVAQKASEAAPVPSTVDDEPVW